jgi:hypothetical protein
MLGSLVDSNGWLSKNGEVHFSRKTYNSVIDEGQSRFNTPQRY